MADITVIGSNMFELTTYVNRMPVQGETLEAPEFTEGFGGKGANQAIAAARLGAKVNFLTMIGNDYFGKQQYKNYLQSGIQTDGILTGNGASGVAPIFVEKSGHNRILIVKGANDELTPQILDQNIELIKDSKLIVLQQEINLETNYHAIDLANELDIPVLLNPAPADEHVDINYVAKVDYFTPNETELGILTGLPTESVSEIKIAARKLIELGTQHLIITLGSKGVLWVDENHEEIIPAVSVKAVDTTGAGDAFNGSFAYYITQGESIEEAIHHANIYAAMTVTKRGTQTSYPTNLEVMKYINGVVQ